MQHKYKIKKIYYIEMFITISIALLSCFTFYDYQTKQVLDPIRDIIKVAEENSVSITSVDEIEEESTTDFSNNNKNGTNRNEEKVPTLDYNAILKEEIQNTYGVSIRYGTETEGYTVAGISTTPIYDSEIINNQLNNLRNTLSLYPRGLFTEIRNGGIPLTIILINNYSDYAVTGITDSSYSYANISIAAVHPFAESFFHESYHYIERYLFKKGASFNAWNSLNPSGFQYGAIYNYLSYKSTNDQNAYFVNNYAQTSDAEDRASTFEYMMASYKASCLNSGTVIHQKANYMAKTMEAVLNSVTPSTTEYWERHLLY